MKNNIMKNAVKIASVYIGTVLGAGFASGQELLSFFAFYGYKGMFGFLLTGMLFGVISFIVLSIIYKEKIVSYKGLLNRIMPAELRMLLEFSVLLFMFIIFCTMFAGCGALFEQRFQLPVHYGVMLMAVGCFITFLFEVKGVIAVNTVLAPLLLIGCVLVGFYLWFFRSVETMGSLFDSLYSVRNNWISSSVIYVAYNSVTAIVILCSLRSVINHVDTIKLASFISGVTLGVVGLILGVIILIHYNEVAGLEIPMLRIVMYYDEWIQHIYIGVLIAAMFTTAVANGFGIIEKVKERHVYFRDNRIIALAGVIVAAMLMSNIGFSTLVRRIYPVFGYIGIFEIAAIIVYYVLEKMRMRKTR